MMLADAQSVHMTSHDSMVALNTFRLKITILRALSSSSLSVTTSIDG